MELIQSFREEGSSTSPTFKLWDDYLTKDSMPLKIFISSSRTGNWRVNQDIKSEFLPLLFAANRSTYARYMPVLILMANRLPPSVAASFEEDHASFCKLSDGPFNSVWPDYVLEVTENKELKGKGGVIGLTMKAPALSRWFLARPVTAQYSSSFLMEIQGHKQTKGTHHSASQSEVNRWNTDITKMKKMFSSGTYIDPFLLQESSSHLVNFATGAVAPSDIEESMLQALDTGGSAAAKFVEERLVPDENGQTSKNFHSALRRSSVKTMTDMLKPVKVNQRPLHMNSEIMYMRLLAVNATKKIDLSRVLSFENASVPLSLFNEDSTMNTGVKSDMLHKLETLGEDITQESLTGAPSVIIHDGHAVIHLLTPPKSEDKVTFRQMAENFMKYILASRPEHVVEIHIAFDRYFQESVKKATREKRRGTKPPSNVIHINAETTIPANWNSYLSMDENKENLATFYSDFLAGHIGALLKPHQSLFVSGGKGEDMMKVTSTSCTKIGSCNHEEADTRLILMAHMAAKRGERCIIIASPDTDVLLLAIHHMHAFKDTEIYFLTGKTSSRRYIAVHKIIQYLNENQRNIILALYCLSGCDTVSFLRGHGKKTAFKILMSNSEKLQGLKSLGNSPTLSESTVISATRFICLMYGRDVESLNKLRLHMVNNGTVLAKKLPPTDDSFFLHLKRAVYQLLIWRQALLPIMETPHPVQLGYTVDNSTKVVMPQMMSQGIAAPELLNSLVCKCAGSCTDGCTCSENNQPCTMACTCHDSMDMNNSCCNTANSSL